MNLSAEPKNQQERLMDGLPKELSLLSFQTCEHIVTMLHQVEAGAAWHESATHARIVYLEKLGAEFGKVMSYRLLTITAPRYRAWATMRLKEMEPWGIA